MSRPDAGRIGELDALRGLAALSVALYHYTDRFPRVFDRPWPIALTFSNGHLGVELFFMISGFVIAMTLARTRVAGDFVVSRFSRLYPAYWASLALTFAIVSLSGLAVLQRTPLELFVNATMLQGHLRVPHVDGAYWSLTVELGFYAVMLAAHQLGWLRRPFALTATWLVISLANGWMMEQLGWSHLALGLVSVYLIAPHAPLFILGMTFYWMHVHGTRALKAHLMVAACIAVRLLLAPAIDNVFLLLFVAVFYALVTGWLAVLRARPLLWLGTISYTLYLLHQHIGYVLLDRLSNAGVDPNLAVPAALAVVLALASAVTYGVEKPAMRAIRRAYRTHSAAGRSPA